MAKAVTAAEKPPPGGDVDEAPPEPPRPAWMTVAGWLAAVFSVLCIFVIATVWVGYQSVPYEDAPDETRVTTQAQVDAFNDANVDTGPDAEEPTYIPTGLMIQSLEFKGPYTLQVAGYMWQLYPLDREDIDRGVVFPEAETTNFSKVYEAVQGDEVLVGWNFKTTLREQFDYSDYPLDRQELWLRMWSVDFEDNVFLVPDLDAYVDTNPTTLPGVDPIVVLENWKIEESFFGYRLATYNADFGIQDYTFVPKPELYFNINAERYLLGPLFSQGIAPFIILLQLFVIVMVIGRNQKRLDQFGVRPGAVLFTCAAYVFAVLVSQNALRNEVRWPSLVYLEGLHVITYFAIVAVAMNSVLLVARPHLGLFKYGNAWPRILYWPIITGAMLVITLAALW
ncbi:hypothetical protein SAMN04487846_0728 [Microbacterium sp. cf046]|uniref:hypothetical protein n=1 Tax=Microbacterium sp. cf046 TaxID=1761803 RepID=UPI0008F0961F|nr:hypothetical protein [Microbacterium sp. cf046]SFR92976.1 hypothetical protein SAMN04487846_0728 [Microbacterium sp. cf046]